jgi:hypothetical protein
VAVELVPWPVVVDEPSAADGSVVDVDVVVFASDL